MAQPQIRMSITPVRPDGSIHCYHDKRLLMQTSHTKSHPNQHVLCLPLHNLYFAHWQFFNRTFFCCPYPKEGGRCPGGFFWLDNLRLNPKWDEALFRNAYGIPLEEDLEGVSLSPSDTAQKRRVSEDAQPGPSVSPKRARHDDNDHFSTFSLLDTRVPRIIDPSTPSRSALRDDRTSGWPMTPPSTSLARANRTLAEVPSSPSEESARRRGRRIHGPQSRCLQNFDSVMSEISSTSDGLSPRSFAQPTVADELDTMLMRLKSIPEHIRKLERLQDAKQGMIDGRNSRIHTLQTELERAMQENEKLIRENERLTRENERLSRTLSHTS
ncbi:hypothetical protein AX15_006517 [Amanita polypyramis BW_CC]|nr:hypothetical protein AX15_006517 [Amanita polypyramis BW_CC]